MIYVDQLFVVEHTRYVRPSRLLLTPLRLIYSYLRCSYGYGYTLVRLPGAVVVAIYVVGGMPVPDLIPFTLHLRLLIVGASLLLARTLLRLLYYFDYRTPGQVTAFGYAHLADALCSLFITFI